MPSPSVTIALALKLSTSILDTVALSASTVPVTLPVIVPVIVPDTVKLLRISTAPVPLGTSTILALLCVPCILLSTIFKPVVLILSMPEISSAKLKDNALPAASTFISFVVPSACSVSPTPMLPEPVLPAVAIAP